MAEETLRIPYGKMDFAVMHREALDQLEKYSADKALQQKAEGNGWTLHKLAVVFCGWECQLCEEV